MSNIELDVYAGTDVGRVRLRNEDSYLADSEQLMFAVADGMGGHSGGDEASKSAVKKLQQDFTTNNVEFSDSEFTQLLVDMVSEVNQHIFERNESRGFKNGSGMGTTLVGVALSKSKAQGVIFNVGDSRVYRYRDSQIEQLTRDHTVYQNWLESGRVGPEPTKNLILQAVGLSKEVQVDTSEVAVKPLDMLLLCSDGLTGSLEDSAIESLLAEHAADSAELIVEQLIKQANLAGGEDNITVVLVKLNQA